MIKSFVQPIYNRLIRGRIPKRFGVYNGIPVKNVPLFDFTDEWPNHEEPNVRAHQTYTKRGDHVVMLGGGYAVSAVHAARAVGKEGSVTVYEPARESVILCRSTIAKQGLSDRVEIVHAAVGPINNPYGAVNEAKRYEPEDLPKCDVLEIDIEGGELDVLNSLEIRPRNIFLETHGTADVSIEDGQNALKELDYEIIETSPEFVEKDIYVIVARRRKNRGRS